MSASRVAVVTGGVSGIGRAIAAVLASEGYSIAVLDKALVSNDALVEELKSLGAPSAIIRPFDLSNVESHSAVVAEIEKTLGSISVLVNNAGVPARVRGDLLDIEPDAFDFALDVNLRGTFFLTQEVAKRMVAQATSAEQPQVIVTISSVSATMASIERGDYCLSKAALPMLTQLFALRLAVYGIGVFEVRPGIIRTPMTAQVTSRYDQLIAEGLVPSGRWGEPEDIAKTVAHLATGALNFSTGSVIAADGGLSVARF